MDCIFCKIVKGEVPCSKIYEDENILAFLDINPSNPGHTLVVTKKHYANIQDVPEEAVCKAMSVVKKIAEAVQKGVNAQAFNIGVNNGRAAGQLIDHLHFHIIPRFASDGLEMWKQKKYREGEIEQTRKSILRYL